MERLTYTDKEMEEMPGMDCPVREDDGSIVQKFCGEVCGEFGKDCPYKEMGKKLKEYEDAEEQGLLFRLPCKVGDTVYKLWYKPCHKGEDHPDTYSCCGCEDKCDIERTIYEFTVPNLDWILTNMKYFGDLVWFLTKAEAEKALAEMG